MKKTLLFLALSLTALTMKAQIAYTATQTLMPRIADTSNGITTLVVPIKVCIYGDTNRNKVFFIDEVICRFPATYSNQQEAPLVKDSISAYIRKYYTYGTN